MKISYKLDSNINGNKKYIGKIDNFVDNFKNFEYYKFGENQNPYNYLIIQNENGGWFFAENTDEGKEIIRRIENENHKD